MQEHSYSIDIEATPEELWAIFWYRGPRPKRRADSGPPVTIEILHPGDEIGEGLVRHCTFRVPKYLLSGGKGQSWEWLTEVRPHESWRYDAVGKPLWSRAEGRTRLEDLGDGRTRLHFTERYEAFNPIMRLLLERRVHHFISKDNDVLIAAALNEGVAKMRKAKARVAAEKTADEDAATELRSETSAHASPSQPVSPPQPSEAHPRQTPSR
jgi:hypothetical protein